MKIDRLIGILSILLQKEKVTAPYLADKFEVSRRTINRDIEALCKAGIPIVTSQGQNGGIWIMEGYRVDRTLLTSSELQAILAGLKSLDSVSGTNRYQQLMEKLSAGTSSTLSPGGHILIDLSSWYKDSLAPKIAQIQEAIEARRKIRFFYVSPQGQGERQIEPYLLVFQWTSWYVWGYCDARQDYRLFKLNRILDLEKTSETYEMRKVPVPDFTSERIFPTNLDVTILFESQAKWRLIEEFGVDSFKERPDGKLLFHFGFTDRENLFSWLLGFGNQAELLEPSSLRAELKALAEQVGAKYREDGSEEDREEPERNEYGERGE